MYGGITVLYVPISCDADARRASKHVVGGGTNQSVAVAVGVYLH
jgi:hypothetical protein